MIFKVRAARPRGSRGVSGYGPRWRLPPLPRRLRRIRADADTLAALRSAGLRRGGLRLGSGLGVASRCKPLGFRYTPCAPAISHDRARLARTQSRRLGATVKPWRLDDLIDCSAH